MGGPHDAAREKDRAAAATVCVCVPLITLSAFIGADSGGSAKIINRTAGPVPDLKFHLMKIAL
jgi:hypothetical protein